VTRGKRVPAGDGVLSWHARMAELRESGAATLVAPREAAVQAVAEDDPEAALAAVQAYRKVVDRYWLKLARTATALDDEFRAMDERRSDTDAVARNLAGAGGGTAAERAALPAGAGPAGAAQQGKPRPPRPVQPPPDLGTQQWPDPRAAKTVPEFLQALRDYRTWAGSPSCKRISAGSGGRYSKSAIYAALAGRKLPGLELVDAIITGCGGDDHARGAFASAWRKLMIGARPPAVWPGQRSR
jgi:hypothetical protein